VSLKGTDARSVFEQKFGAQGVTAKPGPLDAVVDPVTGNLVVAMGVDGVLVRLPGGEWRWISVGEYQRTDLRTARQVITLLSGELWLCLAIVMLVFATLVWRLGKRRWYNAITIVGWVGWLAVVWLIPPAIMSGYASMIVPFGMIPTILVALVAAIVKGVAAYRSVFKAVYTCVLAAVVVGILFAVPYVLWAAGVIAFYRTAAGLATGLLVVLLIGSILTFSKRPVVPSSEDHQNQPVI
jgi:hypothetical protein